MIGFSEVRRITRNMQVRRRQITEYVPRKNEREKNITLFLALERYYTLT